MVIMATSVNSATMEHVTTCINYPSNIMGVTPPPGTGLVNDKTYSETDCIDDVKEGIGGIVDNNDNIQIGSGVAIIGHRKYTSIPSVPTLPAASHSRSHINFENDNRLNNNNKLNSPQVRFLAPPSKQESFNDNIDNQVESVTINAIISGKFSIMNNHVNHHNNSSQSHIGGEDSKSETLEYLSHRRQTFESYNYMGSSRPQSANSHNTNFDYLAGGNISPMIGPTISMQLGTLEEDDDIQETIEECKLVNSSITTKHKISIDIDDDYEEEEEQNTSMLKRKHKQSHISIVEDDIDTHDEGIDDNDKLMTRMATKDDNTKRYERSNYVRSRIMNFSGSLHNTKL